MKDIHKLLRADGWSDWDSLKTDQRRGVPSPPIQSELPESTHTITLLPPEKISIGRMPLFSAIKQRRSHRKFTGEPLTIEEISFLVWATQGLTRTVGKQGANLRTVPSGGGRHPFETYLAVLRVEGLSRGIYRYDALDHRLLRLESAPIPTPEMLRDGCRYQNYFTDAAVAFIWTAVPYRTYWRYEKLSAKIIALDSGHMCQNLYLAAISIDAGTCALDGYFQDKMDQLVGADGQDEFVIYVAPVGKIRPQEEPNHEAHFEAKYGR